MASEDIRSVLLREMHRAIDEATGHAIKVLEHRHGALTYPPGAELSEPELRALHALTLSPELRSALEKVLRDAAASPLFHLFTLMDAVTDPRDWPGKWRGATISAGAEGKGLMMWHDEFYGSYREYREN